MKKVLIFAYKGLLTLLFADTILNQSSERGPLTVALSDVQISQEAYDLLAALQPAGPTDEVAVNVTEDGLYWPGGVGTVLVPVSSFVGPDCDVSKLQSCIAETEVAPNFKEYVDNIPAELLNGMEHGDAFATMLVAMGVGADALAGTDDTGEEDDNDGA